MSLLKNTDKTARVAPRPPEHRDFLAWEGRVPPRPVVFQQAAMQAIILCGGKGTRLNTLYADRPKILVPIAGRPFVEWQLEWLGRMGITDIHLAGGYKAEVLKEWLKTRGQGSEVRGPKSEVRGQGSEVRGPKSEVRGQRSESGSQKAETASHLTLHVSRFTFHVSLSTEPVPLGTGGGLKFVEPWLRTDPILVLNGDSLVPNLDFSKLTLAHRQSGRLLTIAVTRMEEAGRYGTVEFDAADRITAFREKARRTEGWINAGVYAVERKVLNHIPEGKALSLETDLFPHFIQEGLLGACPCLPPLLDMGTPEGITAMESFLKKKTEA